MPAGPATGNQEPNMNTDGDERTAWGGVHGAAA